MGRTIGIAILGRNRTYPFERTVLITAPHLGAGVVICRGQIIDAAPVVKYMIGWPLERMLDYVKEKGWEIAT